jgi:peptidoglycan/xylan/chitin deacetylase (PgdA/CDA1 family)
MYHRVVDRHDGPDPWRLKISSAQFEAQLSYLRSRGYQSIALADVPRAWQAESPWPKPVAITFDDGYRDTYSHAWPLLRKYGFTATVMLVSGCIGGHSNWDCGRAAPAPLLSVEEIRELAEGGISFGSHGATHVSLPELGIERIRHELAGSKAKLEELLGRPVTTLAYPYGRCSAEVSQAAEEAGYTVAFGVDHGCKSLHNFSRIDAAGCGGDTLLWRLKITGLYDRFRHGAGLRRLNRLRKRAASGSIRAANPTAAARSG